MSERTVARYLRRIRRRRDPGKRWLAFLQNHREVIVAFATGTADGIRTRLKHYAASVARAAEELTDICERAAA